MTWFKVDDTLASHPKARKAGLPAMGLWTVAGAYASQYLTEGFVPDWYVDSWPQGRKHAAKLVEARLWDRCDGGWRFHQWDERNPSAADVKRIREKSWNSGRLGNHRRWHVARGVVDPDCEYCKESENGREPRSHP